MYAVALLLTSATLGVDFGWEPDNKGGIEYIIQIEPESLELLKQGQPIRMQLPPNLERVQCFRVQFGTGDIPRGVIPASFEQEVNPTRTANLPAGDNTPTGVPILLRSGTENNAISGTNPNPSTPDMTQALAQLPGTPSTSIPKYDPGPSNYSSFNSGPGSSAAQRYGDETGNTGVTPGAIVPATPSAAPRSQFAPLPTATVPVGPIAGNPITQSWTSTNGYSSRQGTTLSPALGGVSTVANNQTGVNPTYGSSYTNPVSSQYTNGTTAGNSTYGRFGTSTSGQNPGVTSAPPLNRTNTQTPAPRFQTPSTPVSKYDYFGNTTPSNAPSNTGYTPGTTGTPQNQTGGQAPGYNPNQYNPQNTGNYNLKSPIVTASTVSPSPVSTQQQPVTPQTVINGLPTNVAPGYQNQYPNPNSYPAQQQPIPPLPGQQYQPQPPIFNTVSQPVNSTPPPVTKNPIYVVATNPVNTPVQGQQNPASLGNNNQPIVNAPPAEEADKPWILVVFFGAISIALNFWLGWMNFDIQTKYRELVQDVRDLKSITD
ncbi:MAG: hypothetical protein COA78_08170 [Blastopirellula sp.]|nr:MAG: hypothetical protein COA78_08170 [Blastopirellula sp.]